MHGNIIAAISTPPGKGGVALIRVSGDGTFDIVRRVFSPISGKDMTSYPMRTQIYGYIISDGERIDDGMLTLFKAPASYTGEDTAEITCHGGILITRMVLEAILTAGASYAEPGEFTRRAFINGKLSLTEAEAIGTLLEATGEEQIRLSASPARSRLSLEIDAIRGELTGIMSSIYARIDYPDEDLGEFTDEETAEELLCTYERISRLIVTYRTGRAINEGLSAVIVGRPNVGKSTLYNLLAGEDAAIVTDIAGTTRDVLERTVHLGRVALRLADTAGIRYTDGVDTVERIGISRSIDKLNSAEVIITVLDASSPLTHDDTDILRAVNDARGVKIVILNKADLGEELVPELTDKINTVCPSVILSACARDNGDRLIEELTGVFNALFTDERLVIGDDAIVSSARQHSALLKTRSLILSAIEAYRSGLPADAASSDIELALGSLSEIDGRGVSESVVNDIFSKFCVGK